MTEVPPSYGSGRGKDTALRRRRAPVPSPRDQEDEVRARLYAKPPAHERTVELLGPVERIADRTAA